MLCTVVALQVRGGYGLNLDSLQSCHLVGILVDSESRLHLYVNGVDQGVAACDLPAVCYAVVDIYGQCEEVGAISILLNWADLWGGLMCFSHCHAYTHSIFS